MFDLAWTVDDDLTFYVNTHDPTDGSQSDADSPPTYRVYEDETGTPILTGSMALLDDANTTGFYSEQIALTAANGFEDGKSYGIRVEATVGGTSGAKVFGFILKDPLDRVVEGALTLKNMIRIMFAVLAGKSTGSGTTTHAYRDVANAKDRVSATMSTGNRTAVVLDGDD